MAIRGGSAPQIVVGPAASDPTFDDLVEGLEGYGCEVSVFDGLPIETPLPKRAKALIVVTQRDTVDSPEGQRVQSLIREAGYVEGTLGRSQVVLLVDESAPRLSDTGLDQIRFPSGSLSQVLPEIVARFGLAITAKSEQVDTSTPREARDLHRQEPIVEQFKSDDLKVPWILVTLVVLLAFLVGVWFFRGRGVDTEASTNSDTASTLGTDEGGDLDELSAPSTVDTGDEGSEAASSLSGAKVTVDQSTADEASGGTASTVPSPENDDSELQGATASVTGDDETNTDGSSAAATTEPGLAGSSGSANSSGSVSTSATSPSTTIVSPPSTSASAINPTAPVPSTVDPGGGHAEPVSPPVPPTTGQTSSSGSYVCYLNLRIGTILPERTQCEGGGTLIVSGWAGPWHNDVWALAVVDGVGGALYAERRPNGTTFGPPAIPINPGVVYTTPADYRYGTDQIRVEFNADLQHFHLYQHPDRGGRETVLVFDLT